MRNPISGPILDQQHLGELLAEELAETSLRVNAGFLAETCLGDPSPKLVWGECRVTRRNLFGGHCRDFRRNLFDFNAGFLAETCLGSTLDSSPKLVWGKCRVTRRNFFGGRWGPRRNLFWGSTPDPSPKLVWGECWITRRNLFGGQCWAGSSPKLVWGQGWVSCRNLLGLVSRQNLWVPPGAAPPFFNPAPFAEAVLGSAFSSLKSRPDSLLNQVWGRT